MLFNSFEFLFFFLPLCLLGFVSLKKIGGLSWSLGWLVVCSIVFYGWHTPQYIVLILSSITLNYWVSKRLALGRDSVRKCWLYSGVFFNLALLVYYKYAGFFVSNVNDTFGADYIIPNVLLPIGISFFTFQQIAYLVDLYKFPQFLPRYKDYALFVSFFPQLIAGPIVHHREIIPQLQKVDVDYKNLYIGLSIFFIGLFKKAVIADNLALFANPVFEGAARGEEIAFIPAWTAALAYTFQIYFDFSGYSDMAIGLARMFGVTMPENFRSPYRALSIIDFWRRWHITLSRFLRDYLYIPLGGNRQSKPRRYINLMIVMLLGGLWHGAGWSFIIWGGLHGFYLVINHAYRHISDIIKIKIPAICAWFLTFVSCVIAWIYFRSPTMDVANNMIESMFDFSTLAIPHAIHDKIMGALGHDFGVLIAASVSYFPSLENLGMLMCAVVIALFGMNTQSMFEKYKPVLDLKKISGRYSFGYVWNDKSILWLGVMAAIGAVSILASNSKVHFIYFQF